MLLKKSGKCFFRFLFILFRLFRENKINRIADSLDVFHIFVGHFYIELILEFHDEISDVDRIGVKILLKAGSFFYFDIFFRNQFLFRELYDFFQNFISFHCVPQISQYSKTTRFFSRYIKIVKFLRYSEWNEESLRFFADAQNDDGTICFPHS